MGNHDEDLVRFIPSAVHRTLRRIDRRIGQAIFWICIAGIPLVHYASR